LNEKNLNKKYRTILIIYDEKTKLFIQLQIETLFFHTLLVIIFVHLL